KREPVGLADYGEAAPLWVVLSASASSVERLNRNRRKTMARSSLAGFAIAALGWSLHPLPGNAIPDRPDRSPWGMIPGQVIWGGKTVPQQKPVRVTKDRDHCLAGGPILTEDYVVNPKNKGVRWVLVFLAPAGKKPVRIHPDLLKPFARSVDLTIRCGRFKPH